MAVSKYIQSVKDEARGRPRSTEWYRAKIREFGKPGAMDLIRDGKRANRPFYGKLNMFIYDPKFKKKLPYYDKYPLTYVVRTDNDGFLGCNLHYVRLTERDELARSLLNNSEQGRISVPRRTLHKYLYTGIRGQLYPIPEDEWIDVAQLPTERFVVMRQIPVSRNRIYSRN